MSRWADKGSEYPVIRMKGLYVSGTLTRGRPVDSSASQGPKMFFIAAGELPPRPVTDMAAFFYGWKKEYLASSCGSILGKQYFREAFHNARTSYWI